MPLYILVPMILVGLPLVIGLVYLTTREEPDVSLDQNAAIARFKEDFPNCVVSKVILSEEGHHAFLFLQDDDGLGFVSGIGKNFLTRMLTSENVRDIRTTNNGLEISLREFAFRKRLIRLDNQDAKQQIAQRLT